jgi:anti-sigma regulatory factor (Ser/Thr protein kinase)
VVEGEIASREVVLWVRDDGSWNDAVDSDRPHLGIGMMNQLMDAVEIERRPDRTVVTLRRSL